MNVGEKQFPQKICLDGKSTDVLTTRMAFSISFDKCNFNFSNKLLNLEAKRSHLNRLESS